MIVDRYSYSGVVYTAAKGNPNLSLEWAWQPEIGLPRPDLCLFLRLPPEEAAKRGGFGLERYENESMQGRVRELFQDLFDRQRRDDEIHIVEAGKSFDEVSQDIFKIATDTIACLDSIGSLRRLGAIHI